MVSVIIPNWNRAAYLSECLDSLTNQSYGNYEIIVVDNGSTDNSVKIAKLKGARVEKRAKNHGFAGGVNIGLKAARGDYMALINNDAVADHFWIQKLASALEETPRTGIVTAKILHYERQDEFDTTGDFYSIWGFPYPRGRGEKDSGQYDQKNDVTAACGGGSMYRRELFEDVGYFDEDFFAYYEDVDLSLRAQLRGWKIRFSPEAKIYHRIGGTSSTMGDFSRYQSVKNFPYLYVKNMPLRLCIKYAPLFVLGYSFIVANSIIKGQASAMSKGVLHSSLKMPVMIKKRRSIQKRKTLHTKDFDRLLTKTMPPRQRTQLLLKKRQTKT